MIATMVTGTRPKRRGRLEAATLLTIAGLCVMPSAVLAAPQTWYFQGTVSAVNDVYGNGADDPTFAAGGYAIGSPIEGYVTIDPAAASPDYDDPAALNLSGPDDPDRGHYLDAVTDFELWIGSNHQVVDPFTWWSTTSSDPPVEGTVQTIDDEDMGSSLWRDLYLIRLPAIGDEYEFVPPSSSNYIDQNGFDPNPGEGDVIISSLGVTEWIWNGTSTLVESDDLLLDLEGRDDIATFYLRLIKGSGLQNYDIQVTYDVTYLSATHFSQPPPVPLLGPGFASALASGLVATGALAALRASRRRDLDSTGCG